MDEHIYKDRYKVTQHLVGNIQIVEIQEIGYEYFDYVVIRHDESCDAQILKSLIDEYKNKETVCVIGCSSNQIEKSSLPAEIKKSFDLYCYHPCSDEDLENLVDSLLSVRIGSTHGDPQDIKNLRKDETNNLFSIKGSTRSSINELLRIFTNSKSFQFNKYFLSVFCKKEDSKLKNSDNSLLNLELKNIEEFAFTMVEDNSFDKIKITILCS